MKNGIIGLALGIALLNSCVPNGNKCDIEKADSTQNAKNQAFDIDLPENPVEIKGTERLRFATYNVENLFDTENDVANPKDDEFIPEGKYKWDNIKYKKKLKNLAKAITSFGQGEGPAIIGLCEIENRKVLEDLTQHTSLKDEDYQIIHKDSPDYRGIDVAIIYREDEVTPIKKEWIKVPLGEENGTRDILCVKFKLKNGTTLTIIESHWPSKKGNDNESYWKREKVAQIIKEKINQIYAKDSKANLIVAGDFNCTPEEDVVKQQLGVYNPTDKVEPQKLYNLMNRYYSNDQIGTIRYKNKWMIFDQMIVNGNLLNKTKNSIFTLAGSAQIYHDENLIYTNRNGDPAPNRSFLGSKFIKGYSDHLPVTLDIYLKEK